jgi:phenylpyruvate tautomerase PptA (4-oxalocrotonate tautomerase family)
VFTPEEKAALLNGVIEALADVEGDGMRSYTVVVLEEVRTDSYTVSGRLPLTRNVRTAYSAPLAVVT